MSLPHFKFALITPTRGDRSILLQQCKNLAARQTYQHSEHLIIDFDPSTKDKDITARYRHGFNLAQDMGMDFVLFWEDDDWYCPRYSQYMVKNWIEKGKPHLFGQCQSFYYHLKLQRGRLLNHAGRSSAFNTLIRCDKKIRWPADNEPFADLFLWRNYPGIAINMPSVYSPITIGIKHGIGLAGGAGHKAKYSSRSIYDHSWFTRAVAHPDIDFYDKLDF